MPAHLYLAHAPIGLVVIGAGADLLGVLLGREELRRWASSLVILGGVAAVLAFFSGSGALATMALRSPVEAERVAHHTQWAGAGVWVVVLAALARLRWRRSLHGATGWAALAAVLLAAFVLIGITHSGIAINHASRAAATAPAGAAGERAAIREAARLLDVVPAFGDIPGATKPPKPPNGVLVMVEIFRNSDNTLNPHPTRSCGSGSVSS